MDFHAVEACGNGVGGGLGEVFDYPADFFSAQRARCRSRDKAGLAAVGVAEGNRALGDLAGGADRGLAIALDRGVRHPADMPQLGKDLAADAVHRVGHQLPALDLLLGENARIEQVTLAFAGNWRAFGDDQTGGAALGVMQGDLFGGDVFGGA
ncbi:hypothetical protein D3C84_860910 [compost metagenome]